jgi:ATP-dependent RNA helicase DDX19/DBP5
MTDQGHTVINLHGGLPSAERDQVMEAFRQGRAKVLIATNVIARGIDISQVTLVVNYDLPLANNRREPDYETYLHRIGRTGRFGRTGVAINFVHDRTTWNHIMKISSYFNREITKVPTGDFTTIETILKKAIKAALKREEEFKQTM